MRYYVRKIDKLKNEKISLKVINLQNEFKNVITQKTFINYAKDVETTKLNLMSLLHKLKNNENTIVGYGVSGRANTLIQYCNIDTNLLDYIIDDSPMKQGYYTPKSHLEIRSRESLKEKLITSSIFV